jgi:pimeloyl-ACP methyl ester carboxylesterase
MTAKYQKSTSVRNGLATTYLHSGPEDGPLLVLLHEGAFGASAEASWSPLIPTLAQRYRVIAPDLYGYGASSKVVQFDAPPYDLRLHQVAALLDELGLSHERTHLVGNSFGGALALRAATTDWFAPRLRSVISFGGTGGPYRTAEGLDHLGRFDGTAEDMARLVRFANGDFAGFDEQVAIRMVGASAANYRAILAPMMPAPFAPPPSTDAYPEILARTTIPIVAVAGADDPFVEPGWAQQITRHAPLGRAVEIDGRHSPNVVDPTETARLILTLLRENEELVARNEPA